MVSAIASHAKSFGAAAVPALATATCLAIPINALIALSYIPGAAAKKHPVIEPGPRPEVPYVICFNACLAAKSHSLVTLLCQLACAVFNKS